MKSESELPNAGTLGYFVGEDAVGGGALHVDLGRSRLTCKSNERHDLPRLARLDNDNLKHDLNH